MFLIIVYIVLIILALVLCTALFAKISLGVKLSKAKGEAFKSEFGVKVFGKSIDLSRLKKEKPTVSKPGEPQAEAEAEDKPPLNERLHNLRINIERGRYTYLLSKRYVVRKIKVEKLELDLTFGLDDAAHTGIATGAAWGSLYNIYAFIDRLFLVKSHSFNITPVFEGECLDLKFEAEVYFSLSNILAIGIAVFTNYMKAKIKFRKG